MPSPSYIQLLDALWCPRMFCIRRGISKRAGYHTCLFDVSRMTDPFWGGVRKITCLVGSLSQVAGDKVRYYEVPHGRTESIEKRLLMSSIREMFAADAVKSSASIAGLSAHEQPVCLGFRGSGRLLRI